jgi:hypothetical protein
VHFVASHEAAADSSEIAQFLSAAAFPTHNPVIDLRRHFNWTPRPVRTIWRSENSVTYRDSNPDASVVQPAASHYTDCATTAIIVVVVVVGVVVVVVVVMIIIIIIIIIIKR